MHDLRNRETLLHGAGILRLPQLDGVPFGIMNARKAAVRRLRGVHPYRDASRFKLRGHLDQIADPKVDHPLLCGIAEVIALLGKGRKTRRSGLLIPHWIVFAPWRHEDTK